MIPSLQNLITYVQFSITALVKTKQNSGIREKNKNTHKIYYLQNRIQTSTAIIIRYFNIIM